MLKAKDGGRRINDEKIWCEEANEHDVELALQWREIYGVN